MNQLENFLNDIKIQHNLLKSHSMYEKVKTIEDLQHFMQTHVFAVWDFMSLLKRLQKEITCVELPWKPSPFPKDLVRFINEIVLGEESDVDHQGNYCDHFSLYLRSMEEVGATTADIHKLLADFNYLKSCSPTVQKFVTYNIELAVNGKIHEVAAAFFYGRENLIPNMFTSILDSFSKNLNRSSKELFGTLHYYLERHIEIDGDEHSVLAQKCLNMLCEDDQTKWTEALTAGLTSLKLRHELWDEIANNLKH